MTAPARITQADMDRATKAVAAAKIEQARIIMDLRAGCIEIIIGGQAGKPAPVADNPWDNE